MNFKSLEDCFNYNKLEKYQYIIIFSDVFKLMLKNKEGFNNFCTELENYIHYLRRDKTILLPTFNLGFYKSLQTGNDPKYISTGYLNKFLSKRINFHRSKRPIGNFSVIGKNKKKILELKQQTLFGEDSIISFLAKNQTLGMGVGIDPENFAWTVNHVCEEDMRVPYRFFKRFKGLNCDTNERVEEKVFVKKQRMKIINDETIIPKELLKKKKINKVNYKKINLIFTNLNDHYKEGIRILKKDLYGLTKNVGR
jgi:aminoglycoside 3-N-acetyltransferase